MYWNRTDSACTARLSGTQPVTSLAGLCLVLGLVFTALAAGFNATPAIAAPTYPFPWPDNSVVPVFFVPSDWKVDSAEVQQEAAALRRAMAEVQQFYANNFGGRTFVLNDLQVVQANGPKENYGIVWNGRDIYQDGIEIRGNFEGSVVDELYRRGFPVPPAQNQSGYSTMTFVKGAGGFAGGRAFRQAVGGWSIVGDWAIDSIQGQVPENAYWWSGARKQTGAVAHELGHTFDLPHPDAYGYPFSSSVMGEWWNYPTVGLNDVDRQRLGTLRAAYFTAVPPAAPSNPAATAVNGTTIRVSWSDTSNNETSFEVNNGIVSRTAAANTTSLDWTGLTPGTYMCFRVRALNSAGASPWTPGWACISSVALPAAPSNPAATAVNGTTIRVSWSDTSNNETSFEVNNGIVSRTAAANTTSLDWTGLTPGTYMCFRVRALNSAGSSSFVPQSSYVCTTSS